MRVVEWFQQANNTNKFDRHLQLRQEFIPFILTSDETTASTIQAGPILSLPTVLSAKIFEKWFSSVTFP